MKIFSGTWTGRGTDSLLDISVSLAGGEVRVELEVWGDGEDLGAVDEGSRVGAELAHSLEDELEAVLELGLVRAERLPLAGRTRVAREKVVGLEAELALQRGLDGALDAALPGERGPAQLRLDEELAVHDRGGGVEGRARDRRVDVVLCGDGVAMHERSGAGTSQLGKMY